MAIKFTVIGDPVGKQRPRVTKNCTYTPRKTVEYERLIRESWYYQSRESIEGGKPIRLSMTAWFGIPNSYPKKLKAKLPNTPHMKKPDVDNIIKAVLDACNGSVFDDDKQVVCIQATKLYTDTNPRVDVIFEEY